MYRLIAPANGIVAEVATSENEQASLLPVKACPFLFYVDLTVSGERSKARRN